MDGRWLRRRGLALCALGVGSALLAAGPASAAQLPPGFQETTAFSGLTNPVTVKFSPDGRVFVAEKSGLIKVFDNLEDNTPTTFADLRTQVHNFWDRGMLGMELAPGFPADPHVYVLYTHDAAIGGTAPRWGTAGASSDGCPSPPGPTGDGCVVSGRLARLEAAGNQMTGPEQVLIEDWCQQYPSHSVGDIGFGADGKLYVSGGDGASFNFVDWGQDGSPVNPCGDPPGGPGAALTPPSAEGGALRSQDIRTAGTGGAGGTHLLRPNADVTSQWTVCCQVGTAWQALDEQVTADQGTVPVEDFIYEAAQGATTEVALSSVNLAGATPTAGKAWFFMDTAPNQTVRADVIWGGAVRGSKTVSSPDGSGYEWHSIDVVPPDQAAIDEMRIRFTISQAGTGTADVFATYFELTTAAGGGSDPTGLDGAVLRVDPATGAGLPDNPLGSSPDPNARRMVGFGLRNPFRFAIRPGTNEVWLGDVGWGTWEEINRIQSPSDGSLDNFGWPCYEGSGRQGGYDAADLSLCESLYSSPGVTAPHYAWNHSSKVVPGESCPAGGSAVAGVDFYGTGPYPDTYDGAMFFADYSRDCIWAMQTQDGLPSPSKIVTFAAGASNPVDVVVGPGGELYYPDFDGGAIRRISFASANQPPVAIADADPTSGPAPLVVQFSGSRSSDPDPGQSLSYAWDLDGDGAFDDSTSIEPSRTYAAGVHNVSLRVTDSAGASATAAVTINAGNSPPTAAISSPAAGTTWEVGQTLSFSGSGDDAQDGAIPASSMSWQLNMNHCPSNCHTHPIQTFTGVSGGAFVAPDHEYPSHLTLALTVTDSAGLSHTVERRLDPRTHTLTMRTSNPSGLQLTFNGTTATSQFTRTVIRKSVNSISAPSPQVKKGRTYAFSRWSDGGARTHNVTAGADGTYTAYFTRVAGASRTTALARCGEKRKGRGRAKAGGKRKRRC